MFGLTSLFTAFGWSRDDWKWTWCKVVGIAGLIATGVFDVQHWIEYLGFAISTQHLHWVFAASGFVLWVSGQMSTSGLHSGEVMDRANSTQQTLEAVTKQVIVEQAEEISANPTAPLDPKRGTP